MEGRGRAYRFFFLISCIAVNITVGCAPPIGAIGGSGAGDIFWVVPNRVAYDYGDLFYRNSDLKVFTSYRGGVESIPVSQVKIYIEEIEVGNLYGLGSTGRKDVIVEYDNMSASYSIEVRGSGNGNGNGNGEPAPGNPGIHYPWYWEEVD